MTIPTFIKGIYETDVQLHRLKHSSDLEFRYGGWYTGIPIRLCITYLLCGLELWTFQNKFSIFASYVGWNFGLSKTNSQYLLAMWV
jgi:hypothetical protein